MTLILALQDSFHVLDAAGPGEILTVGLRLLKRWWVKGCHKRGLLRVKRFTDTVLTPVHLMSLFAAFRASTIPSDL